MQPNFVCASGLFEALQRALSYQHSKPFIGFGCDGANVNMGDNGVKGLIQSRAISHLRKCNFNAWRSCCTCICLFLHAEKLLIFIFCIIIFINY